jgi:hypothetical protein
MDRGSTLIFHLEDAIFSQPNFWTQNETSTVRERDMIYDQLVILGEQGSYSVVDNELSMKEDEGQQQRQVITIQYKNNMPLVCVGIIDAGSNKKIVVDAHPHTLQMR